MIKTTVKAKTPLGLDKDGPGEIPVFLPEDWVGSLKDRNFEEPVLGMDGVPNFLEGAAGVGESQDQAFPYLFEEPCQGQGLESGRAVCLAPWSAICCLLQKGWTAQIFGWKSRGWTAQICGWKRKGRGQGQEAGRAVCAAPGSTECFSVTEGLDSPEDKDRKQVVPFALHLGLPESFFAIQKGWTAQIFGWKRNSESFCVFRHGDAAPHTETDSLLTVSMRSMTSKLPVNQSQLVP